MIVIIIWATTLMTKMYEIKSIIQLRKHILPLKLTRSHSNISIKLQLRSKVSSKRRWWHHCLPTIWLESTMRKRHRGIKSRSKLSDRWLKDSRNFNNKSRTDKRFKTWWTVMRSLSLFWTRLKKRPLQGVVMSLSTLDLLRVTQSCSIYTQPKLKLPNSKTPHNNPHNQPQYLSNKPNNVPPKNSSLHLVESTFSIWNPALIMVSIRTNKSNESMATRPLQLSSSRAVWHRLLREESFLGQLLELTAFRIRTTQKFSIIDWSSTQLRRKMSSMAPRLLSSLCLIGDLKPRNLWLRAITMQQRCSNQLQEIIIPNSSQFDLPWVTMVEV